MSGSRRRVGPTSSDPISIPVAAWLRAKATSGAVGNLIVFTLIAATAASRAGHGVLSPAGLVAVVVGASIAATSTGWIAGFYEGAAASFNGSIHGVVPASVDRLAGRGGWRDALSWAWAAALWAGAGAVVLAAVLRDHSAPFLVVAVALVAIAAPAAIVVDLAARASGAAAGAALRERTPLRTSLLRRAWVELALPAAGLQALVNAGAAWMLFQGQAAEGTLSRSGAFADAVIYAALITWLFGTLGARWGAFDAAVSRIGSTEPAVTDSPRSAVATTSASTGTAHALGPQALVYLAALTVLATSVLSLVVPVAPSLLRVALVRGLLAGGLTLVACALGVVRGARNTVPVELSGRQGTLLPPTREPHVVARRVRSSVGATAVVAVLLLASASLVQPVAVGAAAFDDVGLVAEIDAFGVRVEYDLPIPAGTGSAPQVVGTARRTSGGEAANGVAGAPTRFDAVIGGKVANPDDVPGSGDENRLPQSECAYPGPLADVDFVFPSDVRSELADTPPIGWSSARCGQGPRLDLQAKSLSPDRLVPLTPHVSVGAGEGAASAGPDSGVLSASASVHLNGVSLLDGLVRVDEVIAHGASVTDGSRDGARTDASVDLVGVRVAGLRFDVRGGELVIDGEVLPAGGTAARGLLRGLRATLAPSGCELAVLDAPSVYPQGFLFTRPSPELGVAEDGSSAASMSGGLLLQCDLPADVSEPTGFSPQRMQVMLGFAYTSVAARADIGGFDFGNVGGTVDGGGPAMGVDDVGSGLPLPGGGHDGQIGAPSGAHNGDAPGANVPSASAVGDRIRLLAANFAAGRPWVWLASLALWLVLTHRVIERVRNELARVTA
ncbi:MAG: choice-of-anchor P family protein [Acidimicrobiales bacterium]